MTHNYPQFMHRRSCCPECGYALDRSTNTTDHDPPGPGDWSICINCAAALRFTETLGLRTTTIAERNAAGPDLVKTIAAVLAAGGGRGPGGRGRKP